jgi:xylan 1,4-beta-xylosidase
MRRLATALLLASTLTAAAQTAAPVAIHVDLASSQGAYKPIYSWFGYDESNYTTMKYGRQLLPELHDLTPAPVYIRAHHLFTSGDGKPALKWSSTNVFTLDAAGKPVYDFTVIDAMFDEFKAAGVRPMVELGFMPEALATGTGPYYVAYPHTLDSAAQTPPKDYAMWGELVRRFTEHLVQRYGKEATATWYWEVWNEPDIAYWKGTPEEYFKLYDISVAAVRSALPGAMVGGPANTGPGGTRAITFLEKFLTHCSMDKSAADGKRIPLDFISFHPKGSPKLIAATPEQPRHVRMGISNELAAAGNGFRTVAKFPMYRNTPIILSEADPEGCAGCSAKDNPANGYRNGPLYPAYTAAAMKGLIDLAAKYKVNFISMLTWSFEFEGRQYFEGFRSLATNGVDKPVLNVFRMAGMFSGDRVATTSSAQIAVDDLVKSGVRGDLATADVDAFATRSGSEASIMLWSYHDDDLPAPGNAVTVTVTGIPASVRRVQLEHFRIDETHSNAFTVWKAMGSPQAPTPEQYATLQAAGQLQLLTSPEWLDVANGTVTIATALPRQATSLLHLKW